MGIFNWKTEESVATDDRHFVVDSTVSRVMEAMDYKLLKQVVDELTVKVVDLVYPEVVKALDKELIIKEVSEGVSEKVLEKLYGKLAEDSREEK